ncbi:hypothetical protein BFP70_15615 [Thioclava sp. SK-1]|uniref:hypothetical protein n=1 Tax=Thioclava sp. SK-1 TaxID=1889770 RepID=UPI0008245B24|nr:hypothetical protein [Thioclava sp. SK-1]OCX61446.1 hypothetical protein BFP70_15615 [Thioclava sp. SK-1]
MYSTPFPAASLFAPLGLLAILCAPTSATAQETVPAGLPTFALELNAATDTQDGACRLTYVATNTGDIGYDRTAYEIAVFDGAGIVDRLLVLEFGALPAGKTKVVQFDLSDSPCDDISRIVVNTAAACLPAGTQEQTTVCLEDLDARSRTAIQFGL